MLYAAGRILCRLFFAAVFRWKVEGVHFIPSTGPVVFCSNHISYFDPPLIGAAVTTRKIHFMAKAELFRIPLFNSLITHLGAFPVRRGVGTGTLRRSLKYLQANEAIALFPEGTRSKTGQLGKAYSGGALIALKSGAPVIPVAISGHYRLFHRTHIRFGPPVDLSSLQQGKITTDDAKKATEKIMQDIQKLLNED